MQPARNAVRRTAREKRTPVAGISPEPRVCESQRAIGEGEHGRVEIAALRILLEPPLQGEGLEVRSDRVLGSLACKLGEALVGGMEVPVVDELQGRAQLAVVRTRGGSRAERRRGDEEREAGEPGEADLQSPARRSVRSRARAAWRSWARATRRASSAG